MNIEWEKLSSVSGLGIVVEDDPILRVLMVEILAEIGLHSLDFETADDALIYLMSRSNDCSLVIADHGLPGQLQGAEFIALMKTKWPSIATILTSGYALDVSTVSPSTTYLPKPWSMEDLVMAVANQLQPGRSLKKTS